MTNTEYQKIKKDLGIHLNTPNYRVKLFIDDLVKKNQRLKRQLKQLEEKFDLNDLKIY